MENHDKKISEGTFCWKVPKFSEIRGEKMSPEFPIGNCTWYISIISDRYNDTFFECHIHCKGIKSGKVYQAVVEFRLLSCKGEKPFIDRLSTIFNEKVNSWKSKGFKKRDTILNPENGYIENDTINLEVSLEVQQDPLYDGPKTVAIRNESKSNNGKMFKDDLFTDFIIKTVNREFKVHKSVLASRSSVFLAMLNSKMAEQQNGFVLIDDFDNDVVEKMIVYMYTGDVDEATDCYVGLYEIADKYELRSLCEMCEDRIGKTMTFKNAVDFLIYADHQKCKNLRETASKIIARDMDKIITRESFNVLYNEYPHLMKEIIKKMHTYYNNYTSEA